MPERGVDRQSLLTHDEQITLMTLWTTNRSPLTFGGDLPSNDDFALSLLTKDEVLKVHQTSCANEELFHHGDQIVWLAKSLDLDDYYVALFDIGEEAAVPIEVDLSVLGNGHNYAIRDLWNKTDLGNYTRQIERASCSSHRQIIWAAARLNDFSNPYSQEKRPDRISHPSRRSRDVQFQIGIKKSKFGSFTQRGCI